MYKAVFWQGEKKYYSLSIDKETSLEGITDRFAETIRDNVFVDVSERTGSLKINIATSSITRFDVMTVDEYEKFSAYQSIRKLMKSNGIHSNS